MRMMARLEDPEGIALSDWHPVEMERAGAALTNTGPTPWIGVKRSGGPAMLVLAMPDGTPVARTPLDRMVTKDDRWRS